MAKAESLFLASGAGAKAGGEAAEPGRGRRADGGRAGSHPTRQTLFSPNPLAA